MSGLSAESIKIDDGDDYLIGGDELTVGDGGLSVAPASGSSGEAGDFLEVPLGLSAPQKWSVAGHSGGSVGENGLFMIGPVTGSGKALTVELSNATALYLANSTEVGPVTIEGADSAEAGVLNGFVGLLDGELNASDGEPVALSHIFFVGDGAVGKLSTNHAELELGSGLKPTGAIEATSVKLDSASEVDFDIAGGGLSAQEDYSQLDSHGAIELEDAKIGILVSPPKKGEPCPVLVDGQTYTFVSTTGTLSGSFSNASEDAEIPIKFAKACTQSSQKLRIGYHESGGTQTVTGTVVSGERAPEITKEPSSVEIVKGEDATFEAAASGVPTPTVQWELSKNEGGKWSAVAGATSDTLTVSDAKTSESGDEYRAVFKNSVGKAETTDATLTVKAKAVAPEVTKDPLNVSVLEGGEATFEAAASGVPAPSVQWEVSTNEGGAWSAVAGGTSDTLKVLDAKTSESGDEYRAVFTNSGGEAKTTDATLTVNAEPTVTKDPSNVSVLEGGEAAFEAAASGVPAPTVQWEVSTNEGGAWSAVAGGTSDTLKVLDAKTSESGDEYRAVFTNTAGKVETTAATLTVSVVPTVTKDPLNVSVLEGGEATFEAAASGVPAPTVQWELSTNKGASWSAVAGVTSDTLKVSDAKTSESGDEYRAVFTNTGGKAETTDATLTVESKLKHEEEAARAGVLGFKEASPDATVASTSLQARGSGAVSLKISCPTGVSSCEGTVTLRTFNAVMAGVAGAAKAKAAVLTLATGSFAVPGGEVRMVTLHLSAKARALLARSHVLRVRVMIVAHDPAGGTHTGRTIATLRAPKVKHGKG